MKNSYIICDETVAVIGIDSYTSKVIEKSTEIWIKESAKSIIENSCIYYGSSYKGRVDASSIILDNSYKIPIMVEKESNLVFFPTISPDCSLCMWISISEIESKYLNNNNVVLVLKNNKKIVTNMSNYSIENQMFKSYQLASIMKSRNIKKN